MPGCPAFTQAKNILPSWDEYFRTCHNRKQHPGFYQISPYLVNIILNENKIKIENGYFWDPFLFPLLITLPLSPSSPQLQPGHHNIDNFLRHHIIVNIFPWNKLCQKSLHPNTSLLFYHQLPKIYFHFLNKKSLMKPDIFDFKSLPAFLRQLYPLHHFIISPAFQ